MKMKTIEFILLKNQLKQHEGLRLKVYTCPAGRLTIGYGRNLEDRGLTESEAEYLLDNDIIECEQLLGKVYIWFKNLDSARQAVMISMCFNMGINSLKKFKKTLGFVRDGDYRRASEEMLKSKWATQVGNRAKELSEQMKTGFFKEVDN
jgi:lysozyme